MNTYKTLCIVALFMFFTSSLSYAVDTKQLETYKKTQDIAKTQQTLSQTAYKTPTIPSVPSVPNQESALKSVKQLEQLNKTLSQLEEIKRIIPLGSMEIELKNSSKYKKLTISLTVIIEGDIDESSKLLETYLADMKLVISSELSALTDKELAWEQEGLHILNAVVDEFNEKAGSKFIRSLSYGDFKLE